MINSDESFDSGLNPFEEMEINKYFVFKGLLSLLYDENYDKRLEIIQDVLIMDNDNFLVPLTYLMNNYKNVIDKKMQSNVDKIVELFRDEYVKAFPEKKEEIYDSVNAIIVLNNSCDTRGLRGFIKHEWTLRFDAENFDYIEFCGKLDDAYTQLKYLFTQDFDILYTHLCCDEESFEEISEAFSDVNSVYMASINKMIYECPILLKDQLFVRRVNSVIVKLKENLAHARRRDCAAPRRQLRKRFKKDHDVYMNYLLKEVTTD